MRLIRYAAIGGLVVGIVAPLGVRAADSRFCGEYARAAVNQSGLALREPFCAYRARGGRWSTDFGVHYSWCLGALYRDAEAERAIRKEYLENCRRR